MKKLSRREFIKYTSVGISAATAGLLASIPACDEKIVRPNVLFIAVDDLNNDLGCYGHALVKSPNIDRLAERGVRFDRAYCQYPVCNPSRSSFLTGLYPEQTGVLSNKDNFREKLPDVVTLPQLFKERGYFTARVGKIYHYGVPGQIGTNGMDDSVSWHQVVNPRGIDREVHDRIQTLVPGRFGGTLSWLNINSKDKDHTDGIGACAAIKLLEDYHPSKTGKPFFLAVGFYRPHTPFVAPSHYFNLYSVDNIEPVLERPGDRDDIPVAALADRPHQLDLSDRQRREIIQAYYASITFMDRQFGRLLNSIGQLGLTDNTIIVFVSDHGYHLGRHGLWQKGDLFEGSARVPLIIVVPGNRNAGKATQAIVELVDLYPTLVDLCDLPKPPHLVGQSLRPVLEDPGHSGKSAALTQAWSRAARTRPDMRDIKVMGYSIRTQSYRYTEWDNGQYGIEMYNYYTDPDEFTNLAGTPGNKETEARLKRILNQKKSAAK